MNKTPDNIAKLNKREKDKRKKQHWPKSCKVSNSVCLKYYKVIHNNITSGFHNNSTVDNKTPQKLDNLFAL